MASTAAKLLVPLSTAALAGALALGSGAEWTSESSTDIEVTGGDIFHTTDGGVGLTVTGLKPGAVVSGTVTLTNTGDLDSTVSIEESVTANGFLEDVAEPGVDTQWLELEIVAASAQDPEFADFPVSNEGVFGGMSGAEEITGLVLEPDETVELTFTLTLGPNTPNSMQEAVASADYTFVTTQTTAGDGADADNDDDEAVVTDFSGESTSEDDPTP